MKVPNQEKTWDKIAKQWDKYREIPSPSIIDFLKDKSGKILDLGCGSGRNFKAMPKDAEIYAIDFSNEMLKLAKQKNRAKELKHSKSDNIPYSDNLFDSVICIALLHCIPKKEKRKKTIDEIYRILKPNSQAFISMWGRNSKRVKNKPQECFVPWTTSKPTESNIEKQQRYTYIYEEDELKKELLDAGFKIIKIWQERNLNAIVEKP